MKKYQIISHSIGNQKGRGIYEESDGNHRCARCNKKLQIGQEVISQSSPNSRGYRKIDTYYYHEVCPESSTKYTQIQNKRRLNNDRKTDRGGETRNTQAFY